MIFLTRVHKDDRVVFAIALDKNDSLPDALGMKPKHTDCRCYNHVQSSHAFRHLAELYDLGPSVNGSSWTYENGHISSTPIYPSPRKDK